MLTKLLRLLDPETIYGQLLQGLLQIIIWKHIFKFTKDFVKKNYSKKWWYLKGCSQGMGEPEFLSMFTVIPQHTFSAIFVFLGYYFNSLQLFSIGTLSEFAFEFIDTFDLLISKYIYNNCPFKDEMIICILLHHIPGIVAIIPVNLSYGNNQYIQQIAFSLLAIAPITFIFQWGFKTRDLYDLQERGQFTVYFFTCFLLWLLCRFYWTPSIMIQFMYYQFMDLSFIMKFMFIFYAILINLFNFAASIAMGYGLYEFLYCNKCTKKEDDTKESIFKRLKQPLNSYHLPQLTRTKSTPLFSSSNKR